MMGTTIEFLLIMMYIDSREWAMMQRVHSDLWSKMRVVDWHLEKTTTPKVVNRARKYGFFLQMGLPLKLQRSKHI